MIKRINSINFGCFKNYDWKACIGNENNFDKINIIYGGNGAGKTTFSRLLFSLEQEKLPERFEDSEFEIQLEKGKKIQHNEIENNQTKIKIYNQYYKKRNLKFLIDNQTDILSFAVFGEENIEIQEKIERNKSIVSELDDDLDKKINIYNSNKVKYYRLKKELEDKLRSKAKEIKEGPYRNKSSYNIKDIKNELEHATALNNNEKEELKSTFQAENKNKIEEVDNFVSNYNEIYENVKKILSSQINPLNKIDELRENEELEDWVKKGISLNQERQKCGFCGNDISSKQREKLQSHFNDEFKNFKNKITLQINNIEDEKKNIENFLEESNFDIMPKFREKFDELINEWNTLRTEYIESLNLLIDQLNDKESKLYVKINLKIDSFDVSKLNICIAKFNELIKENNAFIKNLTKKKEESRDLLRLDEIATFSNDFDYEEKDKKIKDMCVEIEIQKKEKEDIEKRIKKIKEENSELENNLKDEKRAVTLINTYLENYFFQPELYLEVEDQSETETNFVIKRNNEKAYDLSEGEQSIISFCYFLASLNEIDEDERSDYIIVVDDPISSLDTNNTFIIFSLIESELYNKNYNQLFLTTHNFQLLNKFKRWNKPKPKKFIIDKIKISNENNTKSILCEMPKYLTDHPTEFIYLFKQIYIIANDEISDENFFVFYNFPNNARKFLESYLFTLYPNLDNKESHELFFGDDITKTFTDRIHNDHSHTKDHFDRMNEPIVTNEFPNDAKLILKKMKEVNEKQYDSFVNCINKY